MELLLGCGNRRIKRIGTALEWKGLVTLDIDPTCKPDIVHDLEVLPYPFKDDYFDEIHAYDVLEHMGRQGDWKFFFDQWTEFHRILKPDGIVFGRSPRWNNVWAWGDPGHTRIIGCEQLAYLSQKQYLKQIGDTAMTDYRWYYKVDFDCVFMQEDENNTLFGMQAIK